LRRGPLLFVILLWVSLLVVSCTATQPGPKSSARIVSADSIDSSVLVGFRTLTREDFRAKQPPASSGSDSTHLGALLCGSIGADSDIALEFQSPDDAKVHWFVFGDAGYRARMDPHCSWWNLEQRRVSPRYVLEHEQIHFALLEISAREINREIATRRVRVESRDQAVSAAQAELTSVLTAQREEYLAQSRRFDEQTSPQPDAEAQARWRREVEALLRSSAK
jgi:hypothetical protein